MTVAPPKGTEEETARVVPDVASREVPDVAPRVHALERILNLLGGRVADVRLLQARDVAHHASERIELSANHTVVALAGATGSGKSSLFNALVGLDLSAVGVRRPTTGQPHACVWGPEGAGKLLDWLGIPQRLQTARESVLDANAEVELRGLALLDLPDHDSIELAHRLEVDRLVELADMLVWVLDPQKYADVVVHGRYLRALAQHTSVLVVVLNQIDKLTPDEAERCLADLRRLLDSDGLYGVRILATSALRGDGLPELRELLIDVVATRDAAARRLSADLDGVSAELQHLAGPVAREDIERTVVKRLCATLALAAGVPAVGEAVERTYRHRARNVMLWPFAAGIRWLVRAARRRLRRGASGSRPVPVSSGERSHVRRRAVLEAQAETALRDLADTVSRGLPDPWPADIRHAALADVESVPADLERVVGDADLGLGATPMWWRVVAGVQAVALAATVVGTGWLALVPTVGAAQPRIGGVSLPLLLAVVGLASGAGLWVVTWVLAARQASRARTRAETALNDAVTSVAREKVLAPVRAELRVYGQLRDALTALAGR